MAKKGQTFHHYSFETKKKAVAMRLEGMTKKEVASALQISDIGRLKVWMRKYRELEKKAWSTAAGESCIQTLTTNGMRKYGFRSCRKFSNYMRRG
ncbi:Uncharacterised protein [Actinobacillus pleuropneumoniae]|nr:Uncharacterised protein [Actinobacillus pleuropneumoniae]